MPTPAALCSSRETATERNSVLPSPSAPGTGSGRVASLPDGSRTRRCSSSTKYR
ncbi:hypothetical protein SFUMM280S_07167 [Streptomyces fumanus]